LHDEFLRIYELKTDHADYSISPEAIGARSLKNCCLDYLLSGRQVDEKMIGMAQNQYYQATNMTDQIGVLSVLAHRDITARDELFNHFEHRWREQPLVMDKWFSMQALSSAEDTFDRVQQLLDYPSFSLKNPNKVRALVGAFCQNHVHFHHLSGRGYEFLVDIILELDDLNPQIAARMASPLISWKRYERKRQALMVGSLERIREKKDLSRDVYEIVNRGLMES
jgi:aminopeptidase N